MERLAQSRDLMVKIHGGGGNEGHPKEAGEHLADIAVGEFDFVAQKDGDRLGQGSNQGVAQFVGCGLENGPAALWTVGGIVNELGDQGLRLQDDVFLKTTMDLVGSEEFLTAAMRTAEGGRHRDGLVYMIRNSSTPRRMSVGRSSLAGLLDREAVWR